MPIWIRVRIRRPNYEREIETSAKVNTGFTIGPSPIIRLPRILAKELGFDIEKAEALTGYYGCRRTTTSYVKTRCGGGYGCRA